MASNIWLWCRRTASSYSLTSARYWAVWRSKASTSLFLRSWRPVLSPSYCAQLSSIPPSPPSLLGACPWHTSLPSCADVISISSILQVINNTAKQLLNITVACSPRCHNQGHWHRGMKHFIEMSGVTLYALFYSFLAPSIDPKLIVLDLSRHLHS